MFFGFGDHKVLKEATKNSGKMRCPDCDTIFDEGKAKCPTCGRNYKPLTKEVTTAVYSLYDYCYSTSCDKCLFGYNFNKESRPHSYNCLLLHRPSNFDVILAGCSGVVNISECMKKPMQSQCSNQACGDKTIKWYDVRKVLPPTDKDNPYGSITVLISYGEVGNDFASYDFGVQAWYSHCGSGDRTLVYPKYWAYSPNVVL